MTNPIPYSIGFICGFLAALFALLIEWVLRTREPADLPHRQPDAEPPHSPTVDEPVEFSTRMSNEEWIEAVIAEALRKANK
jgi:hypothetical protein